MSKWSFYIIVVYEIQIIYLTPTQGRVYFKPTVTFYCWIWFLKSGGVQSLEVIVNAKIIGTATTSLLLLINDLIYETSTLN